MINIDTLAYSSKLKHKNPMEKLFLALLTMGVCLWADSIVVSLTVLAVMTWFTVSKGKTPLKIYSKLLLIPVTFLSLGTLAIAVEVSSYPQEMILSVGLMGMVIGISETGILSALSVFLRALAAVSCLYYLSLSTPMFELLSALRKLKIPSLLLDLMNLVYRMIFIFLETMAAIHTAQKSRLGYVSLTASYRSLAGLVSSLFVRAYKKSDEMFTALEARGYSGELHVLELSYENDRTSYIKAVVFNSLLIIPGLFFNVF